MNDFSLSDHDFGTPEFLSDVETFIFSDNNYKEQPTIPRLLRSRKKFRELYVFLVKRLYINDKKKRAELTLDTLKSNTTISIIPLKNYLETLANARIIILARKQEASTKLGGRKYTRSITYIGAGAEFYNTLEEYYTIAVEARKKDGR